MFDGFAVVSEKISLDEFGFVANRRLGDKEKVGVAVPDGTFGKLLCLLKDVGMVVYLETRQLGLATAFTEKSLVLAKAGYFVLLSIVYA